MPCTVHVYCMFTLTSSRRRLDHDRVSDLSAQSYTVVCVLNNPVVPGYTVHSSLQYNYRGEYLPKILYFFSSLFFQKFSFFLLEVKFFSFSPFFHLFGVGGKIKNIHPCIIINLFLNKNRTNGYISIGRSTD